MSNALTAPAPIGADIERLLVSGDLGKLTPDQRVAYYRAVCDSVGLNPLTRPFEYVTLNGKQLLYATRNATDQIRGKRGVSVAIVSRERMDDIYVVTARATMADGRADESTGAVALGRLQGEALANAMMKAETKAKRRVTLSIVGLSLLDETEVDTIPGARRDVPPRAPLAFAPPPAVVAATLPAPPPAPVEVDEEPADLAAQLVSAYAEATSIDHLRQINLAVQSASLPEDDLAALRDAAKAAKRRIMQAQPERGVSPAAQIEELASVREPGDEG